MNYITSQFGNPRGLVGHLVGLIMAYENRERNRWALSLLDIQPDDHILEIGFGPGWAIQRASHLAMNGTVAGVDQSQTMVQQAKFRNRAGVRSGQVILRQGSAAQIPFNAESFNKVYAVNSFHEWEDPLCGLQEIKRVLRSGGAFLLIEHPHEIITKEGIGALDNRLRSQLQLAGFESLQVFTRLLQGRVAVGMKAERP